MIKKIFIILILITLVFISISLTLNNYKNRPEVILNSLKNKINSTKRYDFNDYKEWLWVNNRAFVFEVVYMNIFSPGAASLSVREEFLLDDKPDVYILEAIVEENDFFKKIYNAKMILSSSVQKGSKLPLIYREVSVTPEEERVKEIRFYPKENLAERENLKFKIPNNTYDPLSTFFNFLCSDFNIGETKIFKLLSKEEIYDFKVTPKAKQNDIFKIEGEVFREDRSSTHGAHFSVWILDGEVRVPLLIRVVSATGPIYLRLKDVK